MIDAIFNLAGQLQLKRIDALELKLGYKLIFPRIPKIWVNGLVKLDLTRRWRKFGLEVTGVDYFTIGAIRDDVSTRFDENAKQYQSWLGAYLVRFSTRKHRTFQDYLDLAVVDQYDWLKHYGDRSPICSLKKSNFHRVGTTNISGYKAQIFKGGGLSDSDVGPRSRGVWLLIVAKFLATMFNLSNHNLGSTSKNFIPQRRKRNYPSVYLFGYVLVVELESDVVVVLYGNGVILNKTTNTFEYMKMDILKTLMSVRIKRKEARGVRKISWRQH